MSILLLCAALAAQDTGVVEFTAVENGNKVPFRIHVKDAAGKPVKIPGRVAWNDHHVADGRDVLELPEGTYRVEIERGPEYESVAREIRVKARADMSSQVELKRIANLAAEGWWSGELHVHRPLADVELLMRVEDLHVAPVNGARAGVHAGRRAECGASSVADGSGGRKRGHRDRMRLRRRRRAPVRRAWPGVRARGRAPACAAQAGVDCQRCRAMGGRVDARSSGLEGGTFFSG